MLLRLCLLIILVSAALPGAAQKKRFKLPKELPEVSGLYVASTDSLWWLNDGGHGPFLWLTDGRGRLQAKIPVEGTRNRDWEDLTADDRGRLYIGDFGNNLNRRKDLTIYRFDPATGDLDSIRFRYPDQLAFPPPANRANFDMEAFFWHNDSLHLFSKDQWRGGSDYTKHYVLPASPGVYTADLRDSLYLKKRIVTGAAITPDGEGLVLLAYRYKPLLGIIPLTYTSVFRLDQYPEDHFLRGRLRKQKVCHFLKPRQFESIDFLDAGHLLIGTERTVLFRQQGRKIRLKGARRGKKGEVGRGG